MTEVYLVDFIGLTLKSKDDFSAAFDIVLSTNPAKYLKQFLIFQPGDCPPQFYSGQIIYETLQKYCRTSDTAQCTICTRFPLGSNACTIIAAIDAKTFLSGERKVPLH